MDASLLSQLVSAILMSDHFLDVEPTLANQWRAIILFGRNTASYKFALAEALLEIGCDKELILLEELALPFARALCRHLKDASKQATNSSSRFLDECRRFNAGSSSEDELRDATVRLGFNNVIDAFHNLSSRELPSRFFIDEQRQSRGIRLTEAFAALVDGRSQQELQRETDARWRLVEAAWGLGLSRAIIAYDDVSSDLIVDRQHRRVSVTSCRHALNGYQKGHCFYCFASISIISGDAALADVDHVFPHALKAHLPANVDGVWNLVLTCTNCNRGPKGKFDQIPSLRLLQRLHARNEYLIQSHHPIRETLMLQTGRTRQERADLLQRVHTLAKQLRVHDWEPDHQGRAMFNVD